jgi:hypothetical protein
MGWQRHFPASSSPAELDTHFVLTNKEMMGSKVFRYYYTYNGRGWCSEAATFKARPPASRLMHLKDFGGPPREVRADRLLSPRPRSRFLNPPMNPVCDGIIRLIEPKLASARPINLGKPSRVHEPIACRACLRVRRLIVQKWVRFIVLFTRCFRSFRSQEPFLPSFQP